MGQIGFFRRRQVEEKRRVRMRQETNRQSNQGVRQGDTRRQEGKGRGVDGGLKEGCW